MSAAKSKSGDFLLAVEGLTVSFDGFKACLLYTSDAADE